MTRTLAEKAAAAKEAVALARSLCGSDVGESSWRVEVLAQALADAESRGRAESSADLATLQAKLDALVAEVNKIDAAYMAPGMGSSEVIAAVTNLRAFMHSRKKAGL